MSGRRVGTQHLQEQLPEGGDVGGRRRLVTSSLTGSESSQIDLLIGALCDQYALRGDVPVREADAMGGGQRLSDRSQHSQSLGRRQWSAGQACREVLSLYPAADEEDVVVGFSDRLHRHRAWMLERLGQLGRTRKPQAHSLIRGQLRRKDKQCYLSLALLVAGPVQRTAGTRGCHGLDPVAADRGAFPCVSPHGQGYSAAPLPTRHTPPAAQITGPLRDAPLRRVGFACRPLRGCAIAFDV